MTALVRREFDSYAALHYSKKVFEWKDKWGLGDVPKEMVEKPDLWNGFIAYWQLEATKESSTYHSTNRNSQRNGKGPSTHNLGATSKKTKARDMAKKLGRDPNNLELLLATHTDKNGVVQDPVAREIQESVQRMEEEYILSQPSVEGTPPLTQAPDDIINDFVLKVAPQSKGRLYGLPDDAGSSGSSSYYSETSELRALMQQKDDEIKGLKTTVQEIRDAQAALETEREKERAERAKERAERDKDREKMERMMTYLGRNADFPPPPTA